jgi:hypothetical protein
VTSNNTKRRDPRGSKPGERRGGRQKGTPNKTTAEIKALAFQHCPAAIRKFVKLMNHGETEDIQLRAGKELLDRGIGKAVQQTNLAGHDGGPLDLTGLDDAALDAAIARLAAVAGQDK